MPTNYELNEMYLNIGPGSTLNVGGFNNSYYWSANTPYSAYSARAYALDFLTTKADTVHFTLGLLGLFKFKK